MTLTWSRPKVSLNHLLKPGDLEDVARETFLGEFGRWAYKGIKTAEFKRFFARPGAASFTDDISFVDDTTEEPEIDDMTNIISRL